MRLASRHRLRGLSLRNSFDQFESLCSGGSSNLELVRAGSGSPIVMLPGMAGSWRLLAPLARRLATRHEVFLVGYRGDMGFVGPCSRQRPADHAADVAELIARIGLERPAVLGVSYGGAVALELAIRAPRCVGSLILSGVEGRFHRSLGSSVAIRALERFPLPRDSQFVNQFFNLLHGCRPEPGPLVDLVVQTCWDTDQGVIARRLRDLESFDVEDDLWRIDVPTLVVTGTRDVVVTRSAQERLAAAIVTARHVLVEGAGHIGFLTHHDAFARLVGREVREASGMLC